MEYIAKIFICPHASLLQLKTIIQSLCSLQNKHLWIWLKIWSIYLIVWLANCMTSVTFSEDVHCSKSPSSVTLLWTSRLFLNNTWIFNAVESPYYWGCHVAGLQLDQVLKSNQNAEGLQRSRQLGLPCFFKNMKSTFFCRRFISLWSFPAEANGSLDQAANSYFSHTVHSRSFRLHESARSVLAQVFSKRGYLDILCLTSQQGFHYLTDGIVFISLLLFTSFMQE